MRNLPELLFMTMKHAFRERLYLVIILFVFIGLKFPHLYYPFYWDESWPYASAMKQMYLHGPSLLPNALEGDISRGHPLFFHAAGAAWMKIFGSSNFAMHCFALFISVCVLISLYEVGLRLYNKRVAIAAVIITAFQVIFFVQASFVLLEVLLGLLAFLSIYFYVRRKHFLTALFLSMLFYTKESGLVVGAVLGIDALVAFFNKKLSWEERLLKISSIGFPIILMAVFFLLQKHYKGWYFLPLYGELIERSWDMIYYKFGVISKVLFFDDYRLFLYLFLAALSVVAAVKKKKYKLLAFPFPVLTIILLNTGEVNEQAAHWLVFLMVVTSFVVAAYVLTGQSLYQSPEQLRFIRLCSWFVLSFWLFTSLNLFIVRYMLIALIPLFFVSAYYLELVTTNSFRVLYFPAVLLIVGIEAYAFEKNTGHGDVDMGAFDAMKVQQEVVDWFERNNQYDKSIASGSYLQRTHLIDPYSGFLSKEKPFTAVTWEVSDSTELVIFDNIEDDWRYEHMQKDSSFKLIYRIAMGDVWAEIYKREK